MVNQVQAVSGPLVFRRHPVRAVVGAIVLSAVLSAATLFLLPRFLPRTMPIADRGVVVLVVAIALTLAVFAGFLWFRNVRVVVTPDAVEIGRAGNRESYPRAVTAFRPRVTEHRTNGLPSGTTRALVVYSGDREITIELPGYTRATFNALMAELAPVAQPPAESPVEAARARAQLPSSFTVDAGPERRFATGLLLAALALLAVAAAVTLVALSPGFLDGELSALVLIVPFAAVAAVGLGIGAIQRFRVLRSIPARITVSRQGLRLDDVEQPFAQLRRIWMTPAGYPVRRLRLDRTDGRRTRHLLASSRVTTSPDYAELLLAVRADTAHLPGLLSLDLE